MNLAPKVQSTRISEKEYRCLKERLSYSNLKKYDNDREAFYRECIIGEVPVKKESNALILGSLVHSLLAGLDGDFDTKFHIASAKKPSGQMGDLCDALYTRSLQSMNEFGEQQDNFKVIFSDAVHKVKYDFNGEEIAFKKKDEAKILELFAGLDGEMYYNEILSATGKTVVSMAQIEQAERLVQKIKENPVTSPYLDIETEWLDEVRGIKGVETFAELPILFEMEDIPFKCLPDKLIVSHITKKITPIDWKVSWDAEQPEGAFLKYGYYIQLSLYDYGIKYWAKEHGMGDYEVEPLRFIFIDTSGFYTPVVLCPGKDDIERAWRGFRVRTFKYRGVKSLIEDISWHLETGIWGSTKDLHNSKGVMKLQIPYGSRE